MIPAPTLETGAVFDALLAEHGFSVLVTVRKGDREHRILFDAGTTPDGMSENMRRLGISAKDVEVVVLSHGHFDHTTGIDGFIRTVGRANLPVMIHPEFWSRRRLAIPGRDPIEIPTTSRSALEGAGFDIIEERQPSFLFERSVLITGEVDRTTEFERGFPIHQALRDGEWQPDPLILDDQALILHVAGQGLVVLTGCGHAGIVNIVRYAKKLTGVDELYAVIGGFHLVGPLFDSIVSATAEALQHLATRFIVPGHCTGWKAQHALANALPDAYLQNTVGTRYEL
jgi:7,8-dihydropterin-6-yl-methyl-4-(beta-D-ribofuranosyl)aminobenzene 5'-phosphate synthase